MFCLVLLLGLFIMINVPFSVSIISVLVSFGIRAIVKGPFYTLTKRYLSSFASSNTRTKIYSATYMFENICGVAIAFLASKLLEITTTAHVFVMIGFIFAFIFMVLLKYMKTRVGLKPEEYKKEDISLLDLK